MRKRQASNFLKKAVSVLVTLLRAKSTAAKHRATAAVKARLPLLLGLVKDKKVLLSNISQKIHALVVTNHDEDEDQDATDASKAIVLYSGGDSAAALQGHDNAGYDDPAEEEDDYLRHSLFDEEDCFVDDDAGDQECLEAIESEEKLEEEIDTVADAYIRRFRRQMMMQKLESFKRYKEMMERSL